LKAAASFWRATAGVAGARLLLAVLAAMFLLRLATLGSYPLMDTSEARYGEIARVMLTTGNMITPQEIPGTPFWAKPPLYAWLSVASMRVLGINEFALRLPSLLCALAVVLLSAQWAAGMAARRPSGAPPVLPALAGLIAASLLATGLGFFAAAGAVMTDPVLAVCVTAMLAAFYQVAVRGSRSAWWRYGFFVAVGMGMLAKGPVVLLYGGLPIALWTLWQRRLAAVWSALPWMAGTVLAALICVPWYLAAERATPGFLNYFLLGEHVMRFLKPGWRGDLYGTAHAEPVGMIWVYFAAALGVHSLLAGAAAIGSVRARASRADPVAPGQAAPDGAHAYLLLAVLVPVGFFTLAGNIIWTYVLPVLGPLAVLLADFLAPRMGTAVWRRGLALTLAVSAAALLVIMVFVVPGHFNAHSSSALVAQWRARQDSAPGRLVYLGRKAPASLRFYAQGTVPAIAERAQALAGVGPGQDGYVALAPESIADFTAYAASVQPPLAAQTIAQNKDLAIVWVRVAR
jgi:4-amino-4-deoxy-L-arabinose transferase-like glycosyltransferase